MTAENTRPVVQHLSIDENASGQRIDNFLLSHLKGVPKTRLYRSIRKGEVRVNGKRVKPEYKLALSDTVRIPPLRTAVSGKVAVPAALITLLNDSVLYQDDSLLVINKPAGISVHAGTGVKVSLIDALREAYKGEYLELVHRLDKGTSGCLLLARNAQMLKKLQESFRSRAVVKEYHALVHGYWPERLHEVNTGLQRMPAREGERKVTVDEQGKQAVTLFRVLRYFDCFSLLQAQPLTGRTHQIRVHADHAGFPLCGDEKYSSHEQLKQLRLMGIRRLCLHAAALQFQHPDSGRQVRTEAPYAQSFSQALQIMAAGDAGAGSKKTE